MYERSKQISKYRRLQGDPRLVWIWTEVNREELEAGNSSRGGQKEKIMSDNHFDGIQMKNAISA